MTSLKKNDIELFLGSSVEVLRKEFASESVHSIITSPPYYGQRDYHSDDQIGNESTLEGYLDNLCDVFDECHRVLRDDGTLWVNLGDKGEKGNELNVPFLFAEEMKKRGWYQRRSFPWLKRNGIPRGGNNRPHDNLEVIFMFAKRPRNYYYDQLSAKEAAGLTTRNFRNGDTVLLDPDPDFWVFDVLTRKNASEHFATFPPQLAEIMMRASTSDYGVTKTGEQIGRLFEKKRYATRPGTNAKKDESGMAFRDSGRHITEVKHLGWDTIEGEEVGKPIVLDPFSGMATVGVVCINHGRAYRGIEVNADYLEESRRRLEEELKNATKHEPDLFAS